MYLKKNEGFTLIEVIVSIAIIAIIGVVLSGFVTTTLKARSISHQRLQTLAICTSYLNLIKSEQVKIKSLDDMDEWLIDEDFTKTASYYKKTEQNIALKVYINKNLNRNGLFEIKIVGQAPDAAELSISTVIKGGQP